MARTKSNGAKDSSATIGFEAKLWLAADKLRNNMDAAEYKHVVLGLIFLKYISDTFEEHRAKLVAGKGDYAGSNPEDQDEYRAENVFWVPVEARWSHLQANAKQPTIGKIVDDAMVALERDNSRLKGVLPKDYARPGLDKHRLGELIDLIATITLTAASEGEKTHRSVDLLGRVYEYFLTRFASAEGKNGGQFYTPSCVVRCLVEMLAPYKGRIYDPACGSGGMFVQSEKFVESHGGKLGDISIYGQESNATTRRLAVMNLAIRGIEADFGPEHADTFRRDLHPDLRADYVLANPPFNDSDWFRTDDDVRWQFGVPPKGNANFAWVQHFKLASKTSSAIDYSDSVKRFAYIYKYTVAHADYIMQLIEGSKALRDLLAKNSIEVACLGGGPGSDLLGILKYLIRTGAKDLSLKCYIFDKERAWGDSWSDVASQLNPPFQVFPVFQQMDVTESKTWTSYQKFLRADLFTLSYFLSEVWKIKDAAEPFFEHCMSQMKSGSMMLFVDNNDSRFRDWFDEMAKKHGLVVVKSGEGELCFSNNEEKKDLGKYFDKFGWPKRKSDAAWRIMKKP